MHKANHTSKLFSEIFPISVSLSVRTDFKDVDFYIGDFSRSDSAKFINTGYIEGLINGKSPDALYDATVRMTGVESVPVTDGYRIRFQTKEWWQLEEFLSALAEAKEFENPTPATQA